MRKFQALLFSAQSIVGSGTATSSSIDTRLLNVVSLQFKAVATGGDADIRIQYQTSQDDTNYDSVSDNATILASSGTTFTNNKEGWNRIEIPSISNRYVKFLITELGALVTVLDMYAWCEE